MLESTGATDRHVRLVVRANGAVVGLVGAIWRLRARARRLARLPAEPRTERAPRHRGVRPAVGRRRRRDGARGRRGFFAASRPPRAITQVPIVAALSGRPAPPRQIHRSAIPGIVFLVARIPAPRLLGRHDTAATGAAVMPELVLGIVLLIPGLILLAPFFLSLTARLGRRTPIAPRLALRDLARYRARSGSALAAISVGVLVAVIVMLAAAARYGNVLDYAGPNLASNQLALHANTPPPAGTIVTPERRRPDRPAKRPCQTAATPRSWPPAPRRSPRGSARSSSPSRRPNANLNATQGGRSWNGAIYVATPQLLQAFGIKASEINPNADILSSRPGLSGRLGIDLHLRIDNGASNGEPRSRRPPSPELHGGDRLSRRPGDPGDRGAARPGPRRRTR